MIEFNAMESMQVGSHGFVEFSTVVARDDFTLDQAALLIGAWDYPQRDLDRYRDLLDDIASRAAPEVARATNGIGRARAISDMLFDRLGFTRQHRRLLRSEQQLLVRRDRSPHGIPISLSVVYLEVARRVGVLAQGVNFPGHFLVRVAIEDAWLFLDPYSRRPHAARRPISKRCSARRRRRTPCSSPA